MGRAGSEDIDDPSALVAKADAVNEGLGVLDGVPAVAAHGTPATPDDTVIAQAVGLGDGAPDVAALGAGDLGALHGT